MTSNEYQPIAKPSTLGVIIQPFNNMTTYYDPLDLILQAEIAKRDKFTNFISNASKIQTTAEYSNFKETKLRLDNKEFRPSKLLKILASVFAITLCSLALITAFTVPDKPALIFLLIFYILATILFVRQFFINKYQNYKICLTSKGIEIDNDLYEWSNISDTAIFTKGRARGYTKLLIIVLKDNRDYKKFDLTNFSTFTIKGFAGKLSLYIEYFKRQK